MAGEQLGDALLLVGGAHQVDGAALDQRIGLALVAAQELQPAVRLGHEIEGQPGAAQGDGDHPAVPGGQQLHRLRVHGEQFVYQGLDGGEGEVADAHDGFNARRPATGRS